MLARILDLDGVSRQERCGSAPRPACLWPSGGHACASGCSWGAFGRFERYLAAQLGGNRDRQAKITFVGSGDFHHVSLALVARQPRLCNLLVLDNHPDWMRGVPFLHCGTWLYHAAQLPQVHRVFHVGGDVDFDNYYRWLAPWRSCAREKIRVLPAIRSFAGKAWRRGAPRRLAESPRRTGPRDRRSRQRSTRGGTNWLSCRCMFPWIAMFWALTRQS